MLTGVVALGNFSRLAQRLQRLSRRYTEQPLCGKRPVRHSAGSLSVRVSLVNALVNFRPTGLSIGDHALVVLRCLHIVKRSWADANTMMSDRAKPLLVLCVDDPWQELHVDGR